MKSITLVVLYVYKKYLSPALFGLLGHGCRYTPTCAEYMREAVDKFGLTRGGALGIKRAMRCHPLSNRSYFDPLPESLRV